MEIEEINGLVWETLATARAPMDADALSASMGLPLVKVQPALVRLRNAHLIDTVAAPPKPTYLANKELDALRWAQAVDVGVSLLVLERHARLNTATRAQALKLATEGAVEKEDKRRETAKKRRRNEILAGRVASQVAATDLAQIVKDTEKALQTAGGTPGPNEQVVRTLLLQASEEAGRALDSLKKSLGG